ncbi:hypothetical protein [Parasphingopyxis marina]|uniref:DUF2268 domain-containing protein n=1 Tax=Parasphingopyxis marina TaxID=2761622 RepID=A0A842HXQ8_9SPHN|nr:hypothetical protein [Parasphingopyxis marina]MBC2776720.1 hypothetical protein [Parasphingopyxis marina]
MSKRQLSVAIALLLSVQPVAAQDPLDAVIDTGDARRFAAVFLENEGSPTTEHIQQAYLDEAGEGLRLMQTTRFGTAQALADAIAASPAIYRDTVERCLPIAESMEPSLQAIYLAIAGLFPGQSLPRVEVVIGAGSAAGIAAPEVQVIGLETLCASSPTDAEVREALRYFFAHETIHSFQPSLTANTLGPDPLLSLSLHEGIADLVARIILGRSPNASRDAWADARRAELFAQFDEDRETLRQSVGDGETITTLSDDARAALQRWHFNHGRVPDEWQSDLGYWIGREIALAYVERSSDRRQAIHDLVQGIDPLIELETSVLFEAIHEGER